MGSQRAMFNQLENLDFADDIAISSTRGEHLQENTNILNNYAEQTGVNVNNKKTNIMSINTRNKTSIIISCLQVDSVEDFVYFGSIISEDNRDKKECKLIKERLDKARATFEGLHTIWKSDQDQTANLQQQCKICPYLWFINLPCFSKCTLKSRCIPC